MRDFFINGFEILVGIIMIVMILGVIALAGTAAFSSGTVIQGQSLQGGPLVGLGILVGGLLYILFIGGFMYMGLGIYQNTKKTAAALERMGGKL